MPIYAYKCGSCGHTKDVLQKMSDTPLKVCPACGAEAFSKQLTAAGFQLKGTGWYATDFRGGNSGAPAPAAAPETAGAASTTASSSSDASSSASAPSTASSAASTTTTSTS